MDIGNKCMDTKQGVGWDELVYTLCVKQIIHENLLCRTGNPTQCSVVTKMGRKSKKERIYVHI